MDEAETKLRMIKWGDTLTFTKDGKWIHNGEPVIHEGIADYFSRRLKYSNEHSTYVLEAATGSVPVQVEDTPVVVRTLKGESRVGWILVLSNGDSEELRCDTLTINEAGDWYCSLAEKNIRARLLRPAIQHLLSAIEEENGVYSILCRGRRIPLQSSLYSK